MKKLVALILALVMVLGMSAAFADEFEKRYINQGFYENRTIEQTLDIGWKILSELPREELTRIKPEFIEKYMQEASN